MNRFSAFCKQHGLKITPQRLELLKILRKIGIRHPSFTEICQTVNSEHPNISQSTIHNNLKALEEKNIITSFNFKGETHYEIDPELHVNFADSKGNIKDIKNNKIIKRLKDLIKLIDEEEGIQIKKINVIAE